MCAAMRLACCAGMAALNEGADRMEAVAAAIAVLEVTVVGKHAQGLKAYLDLLRGTHLTSLRKLLTVKSSMNPTSWVVLHL
jgi:hypothetical protein